MATHIQSVSPADWQSQVYQFCLFSIIQDPLTDEPDRSRSFCKDAQIWLFSIQWCGLSVSHDLYLSLGSKRPTVNYFRHASCFTLRRSFDSGSTFWIVFSKYLAQYFSFVFIFKLQALLIVLRTLMVMSRLHCS